MHYVHRVLDCYSDQNNTKDIIKNKYKVLKILNLSKLPKPINCTFQLEFIVDSKYLDCRFQLENINSKS